MAEHSRRRGRPPKYNWDLWFSGNVKTLRRGRDFDEDTKIYNLQNYITRKARQFGVEITTQILSRDEIMIVPVLGRTVLGVELLTQVQWERLFFNGDPVSVLPADLVAKAAWTSWLDILHSESERIDMPHRITFDSVARTITYERMPEKRDWGPLEVNEVSD